MKSPGKGPPECPAGSSFVLEGQLLLSSVPSVLHLPGHSSKPKSNGTGMYIQDFPGSEK